MKLISVTKGKENWKIEYITKAPDSKKIKAVYPAAVKDLGLGKPSVSFFQAVAAFTRVAIAISHLDQEWWIENGATVTAVKFKDTKEGESIQITLVADIENENLKPLKITTHWADIEAVKSVLQADSFDNPSLIEAISNLELEAENYINGQRFEEQLELPLAETEKTVDAIA